MQSSVRAEDPRPARTRAAIYEAVADLTTDPDADVSVNAILRASGVSRSGFYAHFAGLEDLLVGMLSDAFRDISVMYSAASQDVEADGDSTARIAQEQLVAFVSDRRKFFRASLDWPVGSRAHETIVQAYARGMRDAIDARGGAAPQGVDADDLATFLAGGSVALLTKWIREEDDDFTPQNVVVERLLAVMPDWLVNPGKLPHTSPRSRGGRVTSTLTPTSHDEKGTTDND